MGGPGFVGCVVLGVGRRLWGGAGWPNVSPLSLLGVAASSLLPLFFVDLCVSVPGTSSWCCSGRPPLSLVVARSGFAGLGLPSCILCCGGFAALLVSSLACVVEFLALCFVGGPAAVLFFSLAPIVWCFLLHLLE